MRRIVLWMCCLLVCGPALWALDEPKERPKSDKPKTPTEEYQDILKEYRTAQEEFFKLYRAAKTDEERRKVAGQYPRPDKYAGRIWEIAQKNPKDPVAVDALSWVVQNGGHDGEAKKREEQALEILLRDHIENPKLAQVCQGLVYSQVQSGEKFLRTVLEKSPSREVQGQACFALAQMLHNRSLPEAEPLLERVVEKYADVKHYQGDLGKAAKGVLFEIRNLAIGKVAPEIEGEDIDGQKLKLTDYRGKVVVLDFWGNW
jgi:hypothetical protein